MKWRNPRRLREVVLGAVLLLGVAACTWQGIKPDDSGPRRLYVSGHAAHVPDQQIAAIAAPYLKTAFFNVDIDALQKKLAAQPWLSAVSVSRHWPDGVVVRIKEHQPVADWSAHGVLAADGAVFMPDRRPGGLPMLDGPPDTGLKVYDEYRHLSGILAPHGAHIASLRLSARGSWTATLDNGLELRLGREALEQRMQRFVDYALTRPQAERALAQAGYVDLRYSDGFAVGGTRVTHTAPRNQETTG